MSFIRIIPITDDDNKSKFLFANYIPSKNEVIYELKPKRGIASKETRFCKLQDFLKLPEIDANAKAYIGKFKNENKNIEVL